MREKMKHTTLAILLLCSQHTLGCEYLYGTWKSDMKTSYEHASKSPNITKKQLDFVKYAFGHMTMTFSKNNITVHETEEIDVIIDDKHYPFKFDYSKSKIKYTICKKDSMLVEYKYEDLEDSHIYTVVNENLFWVLVDSEIGREYFRRVQ
jgi:hypothetical protein